VLVSGHFTFKNFVNEDMPYVIGLPLATLLNFTFLLFFIFGFVAIRVITSNLFEFFKAFFCLYDKVRNKEKSAFSALIRTVRETFVS
jgi:hypothetical protein